MKKEKNGLPNLTREELNRRLDALRTGQKPEPVGRRGFLGQFAAFWGTVFGSVGAIFGSGCSKIIPEPTCYSQPNPSPDEEPVPCCYEEAVPEEKEPENAEPSKASDPEKKDGARKEEANGPEDEEPVVDCYDMPSDEDDDESEGSEDGE